MQQKLLSTAQSSGKETHKIEKNLANICHNHAFLAAKQGQINIAEDFYNKAINYDMTHENALIGLAKLANNQNKPELCKQRLKSVLAINKYNQTALLLLADVCIIINDHGTALNDLKTCAKHDPMNMVIVAKLLMLTRMAGENSKHCKQEKYDYRSEMKLILQRSVDAFNKKIQNERHGGAGGMTTSIISSGNGSGGIQLTTNTNQQKAGLHYCKGYVAWYVENDPVQAIQEFNCARNDSSWGEMAILQMFQIYVAPNQGMLLIESLNSVNGRSKQKGEQLSIMHDLLQQLKNKFRRGSDPIVLVYGCFILLYAKGNVEALKCVQTLSAVIQRFAESSLAHFALGIAIYLYRKDDHVRRSLKQFSEAISIIENDLRTGTSIFLNIDSQQQQQQQQQQHGNVNNDIMHDHYENAVSLLHFGNTMHELYERVSLTIAYINLQEKNATLCKQLCSTIIERNYSSSKSWELLAMTSQSQNSNNNGQNNDEQMLQSIEYLEKSWKIQNGTNHIVGYRLANMYLQIDDLIKCINVCHKVLKIHPNFHEIRENIMNQARIHLRT